jgi:hypothetical protein
MIVGLSQASAAIMEVTYTGTVSRAYYTFYSKNGTQHDLGLVGSSWLATYTFDTDIGTTYSSPESNYAYGGRPPPCYCSGYPSATPGRGILTINGEVRGGVGGTYAFISGFNDGQTSRQSHFAASFDRHGGASLFNSIYNFTGAMPASITDEFTYVVSPDDQATADSCPSRPS